MKPKKLFLVTLLLFCFGLLVAVSEQKPVNDDNLNAWTKDPAGNGSQTGFGDLLFHINIYDITDEPVCLGVEYVRPYFYITGSNDFNLPHKVYVIDFDENLINTFNQVGSSYWGWLDLAWDGTYLYSSAGSTVDYFQTNGTYVGNFPGPRNPNQALAYDPNTDHFWTSNYSSNIYEFDRTGAVVHQYSNSYQIYGMAWDNDSPDGPWLWVYAQEPNYIYQFDPSSGTYTGVSINLDWVDWTAGGLSFTVEDWGDGEVKGTLVGVDRSYFEIDHLFGIEIFSCNGCFIDSICYANGDSNPDNACEFCNPAVSKFEWTDNDGASCDDVVFCNGDDTCLSGICSQHAGDPCDPQCQSCSEETDSCNNISGSCDDGVWCNGIDSCSEGECSQHEGDPCDPQCQSCNEETNVCDNIAGSCDDGLWCTVDDTCSDGLCTGTQRNCDDELFCTGTETCDEENSECDSSGNPCEEDEICNEETDQCDPQPDDDIDDDTDDDSDDDLDDDDLTDDDDTDDDSGAGDEDLDLGGGGGCGCACSD